MLIAQKITNLLNGVSQRPAAFRPESQAEIQENCLSHRIHGLRRRPGTTHLVKLGDLLADDGAIPLLAENPAFDFDADDAVAASYTYDILDIFTPITYQGITSVPNGAALGGTLFPNVAAGRAGKYGPYAELNGHYLMRHFANPGGVRYTAALPGTALMGLTMIIVGRPGYGMGGGEVIMIKRSAPATNYLFLGMGMEGGSGIMGGFRPGDAATGETGELGGWASGGSYWGFYVSPGASWSGFSQPDATNNAGPTVATNGEGTPPGGPFDIYAVTWDGVTGITKFFKNGFQCPNVFTSQLGPQNIMSVEIGSPDGSQMFDFARSMGWGRVLSNTELLTSIRALGTRYGITTA